MKDRPLEHDATGRVNGGGGNDATVPASRGSADPALDATMRSPGDQPVAIRGGPAAAVLPPGARIGRYEVRDVLGSGGMGVVYRAHDPDLHRDLAIKVVLPDAASPRAQERLLSEAQAMAKLRHPAVVPVFDVGTTARGVYIVMPMVGGGTMDDWMRAEPRPWRQVLERFMSAGRGLAAAHAAGLVHRDFKPRNILLDDGGAVLVADFGLAARTDETGDGSLATPGTAEVTSIAGTPAYMAPEQAAGSAVDARADQYSFCISLWEALCGKRPGQAETRTGGATVVRRPPVSSDRRRLPRWLLGAVARGFSAMPERRWPTMSALLEHLTTRLRRRRRAEVAAAVVIAAGAAAGVAALVWGDDDRGHLDPCAHAGVEITATWNDEARAALSRTFATSTRPYAAETARRVTATVESWTAAWLAAHQGSCRATHVRHEQSAQLADLRTTCLERARAGFTAQLAAWTGAVADEADAAVDHAIAAAARLPDVTGCSDVAALDDVAPMPAAPAQRAQIQAAQAEVEALRLRLLRTAVPDGVAHATALVGRAEALGYPLLTIDALRVLAVAHTAIGAHDQTAATLRRRVQAAAAARAYTAEAEAWIELIFQIGVEQLRFDEALALREAGEAALLRAGGGSRLDAKLRYRLGQIYALKGEPREALASLRRARQLAGEDDPEVASEIDVALAGSLGDTGEFVAASELLAAAERRTIAGLGPNHPQVAFVLAARAVADHGRGDLRAAATAMRAAITKLEDLQGGNPDEIATLRHNLAVILVDLDQLDEARTEIERVLAVRRREEPSQPIGLANTLAVLAVINGAQRRPAEAGIAARAAIAALAALGADHPDLADTHNVLAQAMLDAGDLPAARRHADEAIRIFTMGGADLNERRARALHRRGDIAMAAGDRARARRDYDRALALAEQLTGDGGVTAMELSALIGQTLLDASQARAALPYLQRATTLAESAVGHTDGPMYRYLFGRARVETGDARDAGWIAVRAARDELAAAADPRVTDVEAWIAAHR